MTDYPEDFELEALVHKIKADKEFSTDCEKPEYQACLKWIKEQLEPVENIPNRPKDSYSLKHVMERDICLYVNNNVFKAAMLDSGYKCKASEIHNGDDLCHNLHFNVSKKSPVFKRVLTYGGRGSVYIQENYICSQWEAEHGKRWNWEVYVK